ncbi:MAG: DUF4011 domain-containing protein [Phocaeicola sp.]
MGSALQYRIDAWKRLLLDFGKRNRLINFKETKRSNVNITTPIFSELFDLIAIQERALAFPFAQKIRFDEDGEENYDLVIKGDLETSKTLGELQKTLKALRYKANTSIEEQGINTLYLAFGLLKWSEGDGSKQILNSPLILVPVLLKTESITSPYQLLLHEDEIVFNPTLSHKLKNDFGIVIPEFDSTKDSIESFLTGLDELFERKEWEVTRDVNLTILSFLKINMYKDLEKNEEKLNSNNFITSIAGESIPISISEEFNNYDHDTRIKPIDTFQVVDADSSQQDAVLLSKSGVSFVLQGPPGTGKSQTITNIISESLADGKKVLFVSEKMAALQVVYNRLANVGLADFCFTLHSHKANKKTILNDLSNSISIDRKKVKEDALAQLETLERKRVALNQYQQELHTPCSRLKCTIFSVNGELAKLNTAPDVIFEIISPENFTSSELSDRRYLLSELAKTIGKRSEDYVNNVWKNSTLNFLSNELRHDIDSNIDALLPRLNQTNECFVNCCEKLGLIIKPSLDGLDLLIKILAIVGESPTIPVKWIYRDDIEALLKDAKLYEISCKEIQNNQHSISERYTDDYFSIEAEIIYSELSVLQNNLSTLLLEIKDNGIILADINKLCLNIHKTLAKLELLTKQSDSISELLEIKKSNSIADLKFMVSLSDTLLQGITPTPLWFEKDKIVSINSFIDESEKLHHEVLSLRNEILKNFDNDIFEVETYAMLKRFRGEYNTIFRFFKASYRKDLKELKQFLSKTSKLNYLEAYDILQKLKLQHDKTDEINNQKECYLLSFGAYYSGFATNWEQLREAIQKFTELSSIFPGNHISQTLKTIILSGTLPTHKLSDLLDNYNSCGGESLIEEVNSLTTAIHTEQSALSEIIVTLRKNTENLERLLELAQSLIVVRKEQADFATLLQELSELATSQALVDSIELNKQSISEQYESYFTGITTNWDQTLKALLFAKELKELNAQEKLPATFIESICSDLNVISYCRETTTLLSSLRENFKQTVEWVLNLFIEEEQLRHYHLKDFAERLANCKNKKHLLEEWVDYCSNKRKCEELGLSMYIAQIEEKAINPDYIVDAYFKRFYRLWLDAILPHFPAVQSFRGRVHKQTIKEFTELDRLQLKIAQSRVRERVFSRMPDFNSITSTRDEIGVLKRELGKQRRLMPLRKLFNAIPNILTSLRPCFMMSPLSVSVFLEAQSYEFDLVIFDEASQVHTEDAIGAIMRGKQVIIVGDTKQLPPTSFFASSLSDEDFDTDEELKDNDAGAYQSILDESITVLPERSLRWHYRSRHEHLIAFSNIKIYNNSLITFPSSTEQEVDCGVEYIHVSNSVYDRGGKRNNVNEAKRVAELVFDHYRKSPNRSLGVVTFSEAQQQAIDGAIRHKRLQNAMYEQYFMEDKEDPFFIKNLENVQGDERDTIIFSIGYAKDQNGIMYMNFGPLSKDGGHRRLNVAITRAKYNVKLVGSIVPTDIDTGKTSAEGVKLLRSYIEFAQQGMIALQKELSYTDVLDFDSPFEESVYDFLANSGYNISTQVGCSGFRIDMAVKHPIHSGRFVIGIECDGATYHSSRTARERDRLRQTVLEDMGWTIYRIWSTDWIKDQKTEGENLIAAIEKALLSNESQLGIEEFSPENIDITPLDFEIEEDYDQTELSQNGYGFLPYIQVNVADYLSFDTHEVIRMVIQTEQPIHFEELCKRVAPLFGNQKVTSKVRNGVNYLFKWKLTESIEQKGNYITIKGFADLKVRIPDESTDYIRPISLISDEELAKAMRAIARNSYGITPNDLFIATVREFGFKRTTENMMCTFRNAYEKMLDSGRVKEIEGKVCIMDIKQ